MNSIIFKQNDGEIKINASTIIKLMGASEGAVLGTTFNSWMTTFISTLNSALGTKQDGTGSTGTFNPPVNWISTKVKLE
jgi:hypothetical protein